MLLQVTNEAQNLTFLFSWLPVISVIRPLDYEQVPKGMIYLTVMAKDGGNPALNSTVAVTVEVIVSTTLQNTHTHFSTFMYAQHKYWIYLTSVWTPAPSWYTITLNGACSSASSKIMTAETEQYLASTLAFFLTSLYSAEPSTYEHYQNTNMSSMHLWPYPFIAQYSNVKTD